MASKLQAGFQNFIVPPSGYAWASCPLSVNDSSDSHTTSHFPDPFICSGVPSYIAAVAGYDSSSKAWKPKGFLQAAHTVAVYTDLVDASFAESVLTYAFPSEFTAPPLLAYCLLSCASPMLQIVSQ